MQAASAGNAFRLASFIHEIPAASLLDPIRLLMHGIGGNGNTLRMLDNLSRNEFPTLPIAAAQVKIWFQNRRMKWRNSKERELLASGGTREQTLPNRNNPNPDLTDVTTSGVTSATSSTSVSTRPSLSSSLRHRVGSPDKCEDETNNDAGRTQHGIAGGGQVLLDGIMSDLEDSISSTAGSPLDPGSQHDVINYSFSPISNNSNG
ncbi:unnamed protein product [Notodromas monacha]|uniref:Homeobox domain-containing protein n=1 Tax=Notodromas monacha TaxID=399045 RepID=A0A7R9BP50_9CRUS|nr:unnamed protein product [Notodromas monacha]CAG0918000.1 unnamed protein product [Notodromas monacha]